MRPLDIAVAGCGPAGLATALLLHRDGHQVTLFERFETARPVGSGLMLQPTGLAVLRALGLDEVAIARGKRVERLFGCSAGGRVVLDVRYQALGPALFGVGIHRAALFDLLHEAVCAAGIPIRTGWAISGTRSDGNKRRLLGSEGESAAFDLVVDALGARSALVPHIGQELAYGALWASLDWPDGAFDGAALEQRYRAASVMAGVLPIGTPPGCAQPQAAFFWSLRADRLAEWHDVGLEGWKEEVTALWPATRPLLDAIHSPDQLTFAHYAHRTLREPVQRAMIHVGDAWHSTSPQLGQGANMALLDAYALAQALRGSEDLDEALGRAVALRWRHIWLYQAMSKLFTPVYQSDSRLLPLLRDQLVGPLSRLWPATRIQAAMVSGVVGGPLRRLGL